MKQLTELKTKLAEIHLKTLGLSNSLLDLGEIFEDINIDEVLKHNIEKEIDNCIELNSQIRKLAELKGNKK